MVQRISLHSTRIRHPTCKEHITHNEIETASYKMPALIQNWFLRISLGNANCESPDESITSLDILKIESVYRVWISGQSSS